MQILVWEMQIVEGCADANCRGCEIVNYVRIGMQPSVIMNCEVVLKIDDVIVFIWLSGSYVVICSVLPVFGYSPGYWLKHIV